YYEFQDNARIPNDKYDREMVALLKQKYAGAEINLILAYGGPALDFLLRHESEIFTGVPKLFYFHDQKESKVQSLWPKVTGVWTTIDLTKTLDIALALHPDTQSVVVISGDSALDRFFKQQAQEVFPLYERTVRFTYLPVLTMDELKNLLAKLPPRTVSLDLA